MNVTKGITVYAPFAPLISLREKRIETRTAPPAGDMRAAGVRQEGGCGIDRHERVVVVLGKSKVYGYDEYPEAWDVLAEAIGWHSDGRDLHGAFKADRVPGYPLGAVVCTVQVDDALPIAVVLPKADRAPGDRAYATKGDRITVHPLSHQPTAYRWRNGSGHDIADQLPLGDFTPGRWGWLLSDPQPCTPIPCKGRQGVFRLPDDVTEALS